MSAAAGAKDPPIGAPADPPTPPPAEPPAAGRLAQRGLNLFKRRMDDSVATGARLLMRVIMLAAVLQTLTIAASTEQSWALRVSRMGTAAVVFVLALLSWGLARRYGVRRGVACFCFATMLALFAAAALYGVGVHSSGMPALLVLVVVTGFMVGPRAMLGICTGSVAGLLLLGWLEQRGLISGLTASNAPPLASYVLVLVVALMLSAWVLWRYGALFWEVVSSLENSRHLLAESLVAQRAVAKDLHASEERLRTLLDSALISIQILDGESGMLSYANEQTLLKFGCRSLAELRPELLYPGGEHGFDAFRQRLRQTLSEGAQYFSWRSLGAKGNTIWWDMKLDRLRLGGELSVVAFAHDITDRVQAEAELRRHRLRLQDEVGERTAELRAEKQRMQDIIEALPITLSIRDARGRYLLVNQVFEQATGLQRRQVLGRRPADFFPAEQIAEQQQQDARVLAGEGAQTLEDELQHPLLGKRDYLLTAVALRDPQGRPYGLLNLGTDVTKLKHLQRELRLARDEAEAMARAKSEFLANMSHEIRTPLNAVLGLAQLGVGRSDDARACHSSFERILRAGRHLLGVINDILDYSKVETGKLALDPAPVQPARLLADVAELVSERAAAKQLPLRLQQGDVPPWVLLDGLRVSQVLVNLLANAIKFTSRGEVALQLSAADGMLRFAVRDTGLGIAPEQRARIFKAFEQADSSTTRQFGGTGLGLSISRQLAQLMGGDIELESELGVGSCFTLCLPLQAAAAPMAEAADAAASRGPQALRGLRLLIVDDMDINREILHDMLVQEGAEVVAAQGGADALARLREHGGDFDLVLMDVQMPEMDGYQATAALHREAPGLPVVALTAHAMAEQRQRCLAAGMCGHLSKPIEQQDLLSVVLRHALAKPTAPAEPDQTATSTPAEPGASGAAWPALPGCDFDAALRRCAGRAALLHKLLGTFARQYERHQSQFEEARVAGPVALRAAAHQLRGVAANLGLQAMAEQAARLEACALGEPAAVDAALLCVNSLLAQALPALRDWHAQHASEAPA